MAQISDKVVNEIKGNDNLRNLIVNYVPLSFRERHLSKLFRTVGTIASCRIMRYVENGKTFSKGYGFVLFEKAEDAKKAIEEYNGKQVFSKIIKVAYARPNAKRSVSNLFVAHIPPRWGDDKLGELFKSYGKIIESRVLLNSCGLSRCCGFVRFDADSQAEKAVEELNGFQDTPTDAPLLVRIAFKSVAPKNNHRYGMFDDLDGSESSGSKSRYGDSASESGYSRASSGSGRSMRHRKRDPSMDSGYSSTGFRTSVVRRDPATAYRYTREEDDIPEYDSHLEQRMHRRPRPRFEDRYGDRYGDRYSDRYDEDYRRGDRYCPPRDFRGRRDGDRYGPPRDQGYGRDYGYDREFARDQHYGDGYDAPSYRSQSNYSSDYGAGFKDRVSLDAEFSPQLTGYGQKIPQDTTGVGSAYDAAAKIDAEFTLRVFNLQPDCSERDIRKLFDRYGRITSLDVPKTVDGLTMGMALISYADEYSAQAAQKNLNKTQFCDNCLAVEYMPKVVSRKVAPEAGKSSETNVTVTVTKPKAIEAKAVVETEPVVETKAVIETEPVVEAKPVIEAKPVVEAKPVEELKKVKKAKMSFAEAVRV